MKENNAHKTGSVASVSSVGDTTSSAHDLKRTLKRKGLTLLGLSILVALVVAVIRHYFYILDAYYYTAEFHVLFMINNIKSANLELLTEYFSAIRSIPGFISALFLAYGVHTIWLPFSKPVLISMASALYGPLAGGGISFLALLPIGLGTYGLTRFFLGDVVPLIRKLRGQDCEFPISLSWCWLFGSAFALPWIPILLTAAVASLSKISLQRMLILLAVGLGVRILLVLLLPGLFT